jgi:PX domain
MVITKATASWDIRRSFNDFNEFHSQMKAISANLPPLPKKTTLSMTKVTDLDRRQEDLQTYCLEIIKKQDIHNNLEFIKFFEIDRNTDMKVINQLRLVFRKTHEVFGYRDICFFPEHRLMFGVTSSLKGGIFKKEVIKGQEEGGRSIHSGDL